MGLNFTQSCFCTCFVGTKIEQFPSLTLNQQILECVTYNVRDKLHPPVPVHQSTALSIPPPHPHHHVPKSRLISTGLDCFAVHVPLSALLWLSHPAQSYQVKSLLLRTLRGPPTTLQIKPNAALSPGDMLRAATFPFLRPYATQWIHHSSLTVSQAFLMPIFVPNVPEDRNVPVRFQIQKSCSSLK